ncbi:hypothetical protein WNX13_10025, partial [Lactobacillus delbrueckii]|uniref:hypothetical protein n=1 Tax=Lactobacillus delbrueckii TaxID=1584 RepID=UPI0030EAA7C3
MKHNLQFLFQAQWGHMYWRYFLWNFMGRESDLQHAGVLTPKQGFTPDPLLGNSPNKARNNY